ncbi:glycosyltransferase family 39 protein [Accumulibacter sp.]|uniref:glycosyltransferase family 39 protein n=1 Tax=Accumulibacter sp. TaxID=2053492 RepID=UPI0025DAD30D|nr:glycosyltransferase family 39 protein [Accumulibacter sp.]MCM8595910.1 glycosyltransferase family 39 protein [Accumulibacter sp.]MDS4050059.1 glycosyltransferase family 39 protein [Accumulibacter sp.]
MGGGAAPAAASLAAPIDRSAWTLITAFALLHAALAAIVPLSPQEAYYWLWSRDPSLSYFDHPPLASYSIALTTALFDTSAFGIKMAAVGWSIALNVVWTRLLTDFGSDRQVQWWSLLALNLIGITAAYGVVIAPDTPLLFAWTATIWAVWRAAATGNGRWWYAAGIFFGLGMLSKYSAVLLGPALALFLLASQRQRHWWGRPEPYVAVVLASLVFAPVVIWNAQHDWASFAFQSSERAAGMNRWQLRHFLQLIATQLGFVTPYLLVIALMTWFAALRRWRDLLTDDRRLLLIAAATVPLVLFTAVSLRSMVKPNWLAPAYWPLIILAVEERLAGGTVPRSFKLGLASSCALLLAAIVAVSWPNARLGDLDTWSGWPEAAKRVDDLQRELSGRGERSFVFSTNHKSSAMLAFYRQGHARTYAQDVFGERALQFDFWPPEDGMEGATGILAIDDMHDRSSLPLQLPSYCRALTKVDTIVDSSGSGAPRRIDLYLCQDYRGHPRRGNSENEPGRKRAAARRVGAILRTGRAGAAFDH